MNILLRIHKLKNVNITVRTKNKNVIKSIICTINSKADEKNDLSDAKLRISEVGVQMINEKLRSHLFKSKIKKDPNDIQKSQEHLASFNLNNGKLDPIKDIEYIELPKLMGQNIEDHFLNIGRKQLDKYLKLISQLANSDLPSMPKNFNFSPGWTKYDSFNNDIKKVDYPDDDALVFDVESLVLYQNCPVMAVAVSPNAWYSWCSERLIQNDFMYFSHLSFNDLIPFESNDPNERKNKKRIIIGHNVGYDRSYIKEQYYLERSGLRFLDTMSMHIACFGLTSEQRSLLLNTNSDNGMISKVVKNSNEYGNGKFIRSKKSSFKWMAVGSFNNLKDVHQLHCLGYEPIKKDDRNIFVKGSPKDVIDNFQSLMTYCANDVRATFEVYQALTPIFLERFPHPITLNGMLEMSTMYLPVNQNWFKYIESCENEFDDAQYILKKLLEKSAFNACKASHQKDNDPWLFNLDWETRSLKLLKDSEKPPEQQKNSKNKIDESVKDPILENPLYKILNEKYKFQIDQLNIEMNFSEESIKAFSTKKWLPKNVPHLCNYPNWYRELSPKLDDENWQPTPSLITTKTRVTPNLLRLTWKGYPMHYYDKLGWGYLMNKIQYENYLNEEEKKAAAKQFENNESKRKKYSSITKKKKPHEEIIKINEDKYFKKIPHKDGDELNVGNPLSKSFVNKINDGIMSSMPEKSAILALKLYTNISYWVNNEKRIKSQKVIWLEHDKNKNRNNLQGAILPITVVAGTITRRAVEPTWLTASNYQPNRIGGELKTMIQAPDGYNLVGADVDSQELWIASTIGDSHFSKIHGSTALGWMNLQGKKSDGTDMHSKTASMIGISRDQAKIFNYGRIYGAGRAFAEKLLLQFNPNMDESLAKQKAKEMYEKTKGKRHSLKKDKDKIEFLNDDSDESNFDKIWINGTESEMFNKLEEIARSELPQTPVLQATITKTLEPCNVQDDFITSRINWVVQSSAVDYLHIMLTCMNWLIEEYDIKARFSISIHDEVRYLVKEEDKYRAALALQITNLYTRALFSYKLGFDDLPMSVAFFSAVDIDKCLRKEPDLEFVCPSNPSGLTKGYGIPKGNALNIYEILEKTSGKLTKPQK